MWFENNTDKLYLNKRLPTILKGILTIFFVALISGNSFVMVEK